MKTAEEKIKSLVKILSKDNQEKVSKIVDELIEKQLKEDKKIVNVLKKTL